MQNKLHTTQSFWLANDLIVYPVPEQQLWNTELMDFVDFAELPKKFSLVEKTKFMVKNDTYLLANPHLKASYVVYGMEYFHSPAWAVPGCAPSQLLHSWSIISWIWETKKRPRFVSNS